MPEPKKTVILIGAGLRDEVMDMASYRKNLNLSPRSINKDRETLIDAASPDLYIRIVSMYA